MIIKRNDILLIAAIILAAVLFQAYSALQQDGKTVSIFIDGQLHGEYNLSADREIVVVNEDNHVNTVQILNKSVYVSDADCPDKICVKQKPVSKTGSSIICIPNRVSIKIEGNNEQLDAVL